MSGNSIFEKIVRKMDDFIVFLGDNFRYIAVVLLMFIVGIVVGVFASMPSQAPEDQFTPEEAGKPDVTNFIPYNTLTQEKPSPLGRIREDQIHVYKDRILIEIKDAEWATFTDTNSMDPVLDSDTYAIEIVPNESKDIIVGDIISYKSEYASGTIIHRVIEIGEDENGWYARAKGDNNRDVDPGKIRFPQIKRVVVAVIY